MKSLIFTVALLASSVASAQYFRVEARVNVNANQVSAVVANTFYEPVECVARAFGQLNNGQVVHATLRDIVPMNQFRHAHVYSYVPGLYFVNGWAEAHCRFLR